jgi:hypothetical protein
MWSQDALPKVTKRVVYVDPSGISNLAQLAVSQGHCLRHHSDFYRRLFVQLRRLVLLQAIVCPQSRAHGYESACDGQLEPALLAVLGLLSAGIRFQHTQDIESVQW